MDSNQNNRMTRKEREAALKKQAKIKQNWQIAISVSAIVLVFALIITLLSQCGKEKPATGLRELAGYVQSDAATEYVQIDITWTDDNGKKQEGSIVVQLRADIAPITVANFQKLVGEEFYNGLTFHRVFENFMIQGGCPNGNGSGGSGTNITGEFESNGIANDLAHERGVISMARSKANDSASSQFFIVHEDSPHLDGDYAAFGDMIYGFDTLDAIAELATDENYKPLKTVTIDWMDFVTKA